VWAEGEDKVKVRREGRNESSLSANHILTLRQHVCTRK
jgi:hypothetical protein